MQETLCRDLKLIQSDERSGRTERADCVVEDGIDMIPSREGRSPRLSTG